MYQELYDWLIQLQSSDKEEKRTYEKQVFNREEKEEVLCHGRTLPDHQKAKGAV